MSEFDNIKNNIKKAYENLYYEYNNISDINPIEEIMDEINKKYLIANNLDLIQDKNFDYVFSEKFNPRSKKSSPLNLFPNPKSSQNSLPLDLFSEPPSQNQQSYKNPFSRPTSSQDPFSGQNPFSR